MLKAFAGGRLLGAPSGAAPPTVLALHGWQRTHTDFDATLTGLDAIALDLPGHGAAALPDGAWGSAEYAAHIAPILDEMTSSVVVLGHSFGGRVALHLAAAHPGRIGALVLTGVPLLRRQGGARPALPFRLARAMHRRGLVSDRRMDDLRQRYGSADYRAAQGVMRDVFVTVVNESYERQLADYPGPVELVWGADDTAAPLAMAQEGAGLAPHATLTVLPGVGHMTPATSPDDLRAAVRRHLP